MSHLSIALIRRPSCISMFPVGPRGSISRISLTQTWPEISMCQTRLPDPKAGPHTGRTMSVSSRYVPLIGILVFLALEISEPRMFETVTD